MLSHNFTLLLSAMATVVAAAPIPDSDMGTPDEFYRVFGHGPVRSIGGMFEPINVIKTLPPVATPTLLSSSQAPTHAPTSTASAVSATHSVPATFWGDFRWPHLPIPVFHHIGAKDNDFVVKAAQCVNSTIVRSHFHSLTRFIDIFPSVI